MSGAGIRNGDDYQPGGGFRSVLTGRGIATAVLCVGLYALARWWIEEEFGRHVMDGVFQSLLAAWIGYCSIRGILHADRLAEEHGETTPRRIRLWSIAGLIAGTALATTAVQVLFSVGVR
jgi:hypothetical protein